MDSELATLGYFRHQISGPMENPYFRSFRPITDPDFDPRLMLVARLDGPSATDVRRMLDDAAPILPKGTILHLVGFLDTTAGNKNMADGRNIDKIVSGGRVGTLVRT